MGLRKNVEEIKTMLTEMTKETAFKAKEYDKIIELLKKFHIKVSKINTVLNQDFTYSVKIEYSIPSIELKVDKGDYSSSNDAFKAINLLNLLSIEDMTLISKEIEKAKRLSKQ